MNEFHNTSFILSYFNIDGFGHYEILSDEYNLRISYSIVVFQMIDYIAGSSAN